MFAATKQSARQADRRALQCLVVSILMMIAYCPFLTWGRDYSGLSQSTCRRTRRRRFASSETSGAKRCLPDVRSAIRQFGKGDRLGKGPVAVNRDRAARGRAPEKITRRRPRPIFGAAGPTPLAAFMVSYMSATIVFNVGS
jgi:hypothetical protein